MINLNKNTLVLNFVFFGNYTCTNYLKQTKGEIFLHNSKYTEPNIKNPLRQLNKQSQGSIEQQWCDI